MGGDAEGCTPFSERVRPGTPGFPVVLLVDRGDCYFIEKAYNAEKAGAQVRGRGRAGLQGRDRRDAAPPKKHTHTRTPPPTPPHPVSTQAVIVADFKDEKLLTMSAPEDRPEISRLKEEITIPTALVTRGVGEALKHALSRHARVVVELDWSDSVAHPDSRVEWELWGSPADGCGAPCDRQTSFVKAMASRAATLEADGYTKFTPRYVMHGCGGSPSEDVCARSCIHKGRYCAFASPSADGDRSSHAIPGRDLVTEAKRRLCAAEAARKADKPEAWWAYAAEVATSCTLAAGKFNDPQCAKAALTGAGLAAAKVEACVGDVDADIAPDVLEENYDAQVRRVGGRTKDTAGWVSGVCVCPHAQPPTPTPTPTPIHRAWTRSAPPRSSSSPPSSSMAPNTAAAWTPAPSRAACAPASPRSLNPPPA